MPCRTLVLCFLTGPCSDGTKGEAGGQWRLRDERFGYGLQQFVREALEGGREVLPGGGHGLSGLAYRSQMELAVEDGEAGRTECRSMSRE